MNYFAFEHETRTHINEMFQPMLEQRLEDRTTVKSLQAHCLKLSARLEAIEVLYDMREGQNVMLDSLTDRLNKHNIKHREV